MSGLFVVCFAFVCVSHNKSGACVWFVSPQTKSFFFLDFYFNHFFSTKKNQKESKEIWWFIPDMIQCFTCASEIRSIVVGFISIWFWLLFVKVDFWCASIFRFCLFVELAWCWKRIAAYTAICVHCAGSQYKNQYILVFFLSIIYWIQCVPNQ